MIMLVSLFSTTFFLITLKLRTITNFLFVLICFFKKKHISHALLEITLFIFLLFMQSTFGGDCWTMKWIQNNKTAIVKKKLPKTSLRIFDFHLFNTQSITTSTQFIKNASLVVQHPLPRSIIKTL